jgi:Citrate synthase, C-terminal domain
VAEHERPVYETALGASSLRDITLLGQNLADDVMGKVGFGELAFWLATQRRPTPGETRVFEAVLAALADHGFTPTAIVTRLTYLSAPDSVQGALAAGLLGGGSRFLGVTEDCGRFLHDVLVQAGEFPTDDAGWDALALQTVTAQRAARRFVPGLGHHVHKEGDPRTPRLFEIATEERRGAGRPRPAAGAAARLRPAGPHRGADRPAGRGAAAPGRQRDLPVGGPEQPVRRARPVHPPGDHRRHPWLSWPR